MRAHLQVAFGFGLLLPLLGVVVGGCEQSAPPGDSGASKAGASGQPGTAGATNSANAAGSGGAPFAGSAGTAAGVGNGGSSSNAGAGGNTAAGGPTGGGATGGGATGGAAGGGGAGGGATGGAAGGGAAGGSSAGACPVVSDFATWPTSKSPLELGKLAVTDFKSHTGESYHYALALSWAGALRFTSLTADGSNNSALISTFNASTIKSNPPPNPIGKGDVDARVFGVLPLEIALQNGDESQEQLGLKYSDNQWATLNAEGISADARYWADDMFMITGLQVMAYRATKDSKYVDRAANALLVYAGRLQKSGLFWHTMDSMAAWGRANGWFASGMTELLLELPPGQARDGVMVAYKQHLDALLPLQVSGGSDDGCWRQVLDLGSAPAETSCTAMFTTALATGAKNGWLSDAKYAAAARKGWQCLANKTNAMGKLDRTCPGTGAATKGDPLATQQKFYVDRMTQVSLGDLHGQLALFWAANALIRTDCPGRR
jgi:unsaturated rhamnogalacturonyl hydrolase